MLGPATKAFIKDAIPSLSASGDLLLVFSNEQCRCFFETNNEQTAEHAKENLQEVINAIASVSGKEVNVLTELAKDEVHQKTDFPNLLSMFDGLEVVEEE